MTQESTSKTAPAIVAPTISRETFDAAIVSGDLETIQAFFAQPHVRSEVEDTNAYIIEKQDAAADDAATFALRDASCPWFRQPNSFSQHELENVPLLIAARNGHAHVIEWLFSRECASFMGATLALLLPLVARFDSPRRWYHRNWVSDPLVLEALLTSHVFCDWMNEERKQFVLDQTAGRCENFDVIDVAIAHGARVNKALTALAGNAQYGTKDCVAQLENAGAFVVGANVLQPVSRSDVYHLADAFLRSGVDWGTGPAALLINAAENANEAAVAALLAHGFVDVDAADENGMTPLMHVSSVNPWTDLHPQFSDPTPGIAWSLIGYCDVHLTDNMGRTALHFAAECNESLTHILLASGADPNVRDHEGLAPFDYLDHDYVFGCSRWRELVKPFLDGGFDPFAIARPLGPTIAEQLVTPGEGDDCVRSEQNVQDVFEDEYRSLYQHLVEVEGGLEFITQNAQYFELEGVRLACESKESTE